MVVVSSSALPREKQKLKEELACGSLIENKISFVFSMCAHLAERGAEGDDGLGREWKGCGMWHHGKGGTRSAGRGGVWHHVKGGTHVVQDEVGCGITGRAART